jgi:hypothetical protein
MIGLAFGALSTLGTIGQFAGNLMGASARRAQMRDQIRAMEMKKAQVVGLAAAKSGASGVEGTSASTMSYLQGLGAEYDLAIGRQKQANSAADLANNIGSIASLFGGGAQMYKGLGDINNWDFG